jgi:outer membrane protein assembly factor BamB
MPMLKSDRARGLALTAAAALWLAVAACSSKNKPDKPAELLAINTTLKVERVWDTSVGGEYKLRLGLNPAVVDGVVYLASPKGEVEARQLDGGKELWRQKVKLPLAGGPGVGNGLVVIGAANGQVVALDAKSGAQRWRAFVAGEVLAAPAVGNDVVVVRTVDGKLHCLEIKDGVQRWVADQQLPRLTLRGNAPPLISGDLAIAGFDNGRLVAVSLSNGSTVWDTAIGQARGSSELQRLVDIDSSVAIDGDDLFVVSFQGRVARVARDSGQIIWAKDMSSYRGLALSAEAVFISAANGEVVKLDRSSGGELWRQSTLLRRQLSAPVLSNGHLVVADLEGVVHWINASDGRVVARTSVGKRVSGAPLAVNGLVLVSNDDGALSVFRAAGSAPAS